MKEDNIVDVLVDLSKLDIDIRKEIVFKPTLNTWIEKKMIYYENLMAETDGYNHVAAGGHLDMLIQLKEYINKGGSI